MRVKGTAVLTLPLFIQEKFGREGLEEWLTSLSEEAKEVYGYPVLSSNWYPIKEILVEPTEKICELFYNGDLKGAWDSGRYSAEYGLKGIYKMFVKFGSVHFLVKKASTILPTYYEECSIEVKEFVDTRSTLHITKFPLSHQVIDHRVGGWIEKALEISGCKDIEIDIPQSLAQNDPVSEFKLSWS